MELAARRVSSDGGVLVLLDADDADHCPARLGPELLARCVAQRSDVSISVVLAKREFETWFLAAASSLAGRRGLAPDLRAPDEPEEVRGAKEWLRRRMAVGATSSPTQDQPAPTTLFDLKCGPGCLALVRQVPSGGTRLLGGRGKPDRP